MSEMPEPATLLFVDDEPGILSALRRLFRPHGYRILVAESGAAGLAQLEQEPVDLIISDMRMPEMDGAAFLKKVCQRWPSTMRILLTGYAGLTALTQAQNEELKILNTGLERKVAERTAELQQALTFVEQTHGELKKSFLATVQVFAGLVELRSGPGGNQLAGHGRRVAELARTIAQRLGLSDGETQNIMLAGLLHDIGKLGLPDELLTKPFNTLRPEQRAQVMKHPQIGQNILMGIARFREAAILVRHHHEYFDGSGYPDHLAGISIPQGARILAVANDYDALQIGTLVQRPLHQDEALAFLNDNRGKRYDPAAVDAIFRLISESQKSVPVELPLRTMHLKPGMVLNRDLMHRDGYLLLSTGSTLTADIIAQLLRMEHVEQQSLTLYIRQEEK